MLTLQISTRDSILSSSMCGTRRSIKCSKQVFCRLNIVLYADSIVETIYQITSIFIFREHPARDPESIDVVSWCFESSQQQRIASGLNTNFTICPSYSFHKSSYQKSCFFVVVFFLSLLILYSVGTQQGNLHPAW